jgi:hypothetical protein
MNACTLDPLDSTEEIKVNQNKKTTAKSGTNSVASIEYETNPFSVENVENAITYLGGKRQIDKDRIYHYYKFDPSTVTGEMLELIEKDSTHHILDYPFANAKIYNDEFGEKAEENIEKLKDGNLYIVFKTGGELQILFENRSALKAEKLDELYLPDDNDEELLEYLVNQNQIELRLPCLFKRPQGRITYFDQELARNRPVPNIQVWALVFGIPVATWTDAQGNYAIPYRFSAGTFMGTHAKSPRINIKPLNTVGGFLQSIPQIASNFIIGSVHNAGWYNACRMRDDINIDFNTHGQPRYWAQILDAINLHDNYTRQDGIPNAPWELVWYAHWDENGGAYSTPMLAHFNTNQYPSLPNVIDIIGFGLGLNLNLLSVNTKSLFRSLAPDITSRERNVMRITNAGVNHYSERMMQTCFHELAHASYFRKVGGLYWSYVIGGVVFGGCGSNYGCGNVWFAGPIQLNEAWAEYLGKEHHRRIHPTTGLVDISNRIDPNTNWQPYTPAFRPTALEIDGTFSEDWIPTGIFYDYTDGINALEPRDNVFGFTIAEMYNVFNPLVLNICTYQDNLVRRYPNRITTQQSLDILFINAPTLNCNR